MLLGIKDVVRVCCVWGRDTFAEQPATSGVCAVVYPHVATCPFACRPSPDILSHRSEQLASMDVGEEMLMFSALAKQLVTPV